MGSCDLLQHLLPGWKRFPVEFFLIPVLKIDEAKEWPETSCVVISSQVMSHSDSDGTTYSVDISYSYEVGGREYKSNRYGFMMGSSSGY